MTNWPYFEDMFSSFTKKMNTTVNIFEDKIVLSRKVHLVTVTIGKCYLVSRQIGQFTAL